MQSNFFANRSVVEIKDHVAMKDKGLFCRVHQLIIIISFLSRIRFMIK